MEQLSSHQGLGISGSGKGVAREIDGTITRESWCGERDGVRKKKRYKGRGGERGRERDAHCSPPPTLPLRQTEEP